MTTWIWADSLQIAVERAVSCFPELEEVVEVEQVPMQMGMHLYRIKVKDTVQSLPSTNIAPNLEKEINKALELAESINKEIAVEAGVGLWQEEPE